MAEQTITIRLTDNEHALCFPRHVDLFVGDTIEYVSDPPGRPFRVVFDGPFSTTPLIEIKDEKPRTLRNPGHFFWKCFMDNDEGVEVGWRFGEDPESGGDGDVKPKPSGT